MNSALIFALVIASTAGLVTAQAQTYQWKDKNGQTVISDIAPPGTAKISRTVGEAQPGVEKNQPSAAKSADEPQTTAEKNLAFKKRQQEAREKAEKEEKGKAAAAEKRENCDRAHRNLAILESNQAITTLDDKGERQLMNSNQRAQEMERAQRFIAETCN
ncbi:MAG: hypothetical protein ACD_10C00398G0010 [uncultured bacterium]|nr:MAG: hypothetical protein ACD_10C00398G0010 [uncultured bacterium]